jgi:hypothetical protein
VHRHIELHALGRFLVGARVDELEVRLAFVDRLEAVNIRRGDGVVLVPLDV